VWNRGRREKIRRGDEEGKKMVRFLVIIFDGASEDVPNEDLTLIKGEPSVSVSRFTSPYQ